MAEVKDPAIKLFGKTIQLPLTADASSSPESRDRNLSCSGATTADDNKKIAAMDSKQEGCSSANLIDSDKEEGKKSPSIEADLKEEQEQSEITTSSQEKTLKKPDKILPCPRCNSMDTKFCYFNNYNVNQPRHFCKNCQRYWTAGGTMRNVPVGAGRRKNKSSSSLQNRHIVVPDPAAGIVFPSIRGSGSVLCDSIASGLNIAERSPKSAEMEKQEEFMNGFHGFPAPPWAPWGGSVAAPPFVPPGYPVPMYAAPPFWNVAWVPRPSASVDHSSAGSSPSSPLGKHSRERDEPETKVLVPKTLRIDDPNEAAKSSIWATLGIRSEKTDSVNSGGLFRGFRSKGEETGPPADTSLVLQANPAALSRSLTFRENAE